MVLSNPIIHRELLERLRSHSSFTYLFIFQLLAALAFGYAWFTISAMSGSASQLDNRMVFTVIFTLQMLAVMLMVPMISATSISIEYEQNTWETLRASPLSLSAIVLGKLMAIIGFVWLLIFSTLPLYALFFLIGGVSGGDVLVVFLMMTEVIVVNSLIGMYFSVTRKKVVKAISAAYAFSIFMFYFFPVLLSFTKAPPYIQYAISSNVYLIGNAPNSFVEMPDWFNMYALHAAWLAGEVGIFLFLIFWRINQNQSRNDDMTLETRLWIRELDGKPSKRFEIQDWNPMYSKEWLMMWAGERRTIISSCVGMFGLSLLIMLGFGSGGVNAMLERWSESMPAWSMFLTPFLALPYAVNAFRSEKDQGTWDLLRTANMKSKDIILGKFLAGFRVALLKISALIALPALAILYLTMAGSIAPDFWLVILIAFSVSTALFLVWLIAFGLCVSAYAKKTVMANGIAYLAVLALVYILPVFLGTFMQFNYSYIISPLYMWASNDFFQDINANSGWMEKLMGQALWMLLTSALFYMRTIHILKSENA